MMISYDTLEDIALSHYNYKPLLSEFRCFGYDDGFHIVEVNEVGKTPKRLKIAVSIEEIPNDWI